jgi:protein-disulfide isomerase
MHDALFTEKPERSAQGQAAEIESSARKLSTNAQAALGMDAAKLDACMASTRFADLIQHNAEEAAKMNIEGTPTFLIGTIARTATS